MGCEGEPTYHPSWGSAPFWGPSEQAGPEKGRGLQIRASLLQIILREYKLPLPTLTEIQNPYSKEEPFHKTQALFCSKPSFNSIKVPAWYNFSEDPQAEMRSREFIPPACSHPLRNIIRLAWLLSLMPPRHPPRPL